MAGVVVTAGRGAPCLFPVQVASTTLGGGARALPPPLANAAAKGCTGRPPVSSEAAPNRLGRDAGGGVARGDDWWFRGGDPPPVEVASTIVGGGAREGPPPLANAMARGCTGRPAELILLSLEEVAAANGLGLEGGDTREVALEIGAAVPGLLFPPPLDVVSTIEAFGAEAEPPPKAKAAARGCIGLP